jgi:hypothetical protein
VLAVPTTAVSTMPAASPLHLILLNIHNSALKLHGLHHTMPTAAVSALSLD